jgi:Glycosyl hydrolase family 76
MLFERRIASVALVACASLVLCGAVSASEQRTSRITQTQFLGLAQSGIKAAHARFWNAKLGWYNDSLAPPKNPRMPLAYLWSAFPLFEAIDAVAIAEPTAANKAAVESFANMAERYWNGALEPQGGFAYYLGIDDPHALTYFDDNGWWGIAFIDAFRATGDRSYLTEAARAFEFIVESGWNTAGGGTWWDNRRGHITAEPLAAAAYIGAVLYQQTGQAAYLRQVTKLISWADANTVDPATGLYTRNATDGTLLDYVEGMMIGANLVLCEATAQSSYCTKAEQLGQAAVAAFTVLDWSPTADGIYLRFLLDLYRHDGNKAWYEVVYANAQRALQNAPSGNGLDLKDWNGQPVTPGGLLRTHAGTVALFAWLATATPPAS